MSGTNVWKFTSTIHTWYCETTRTKPAGIHTVALQEKTSSACAFQQLSLSPKAQPGHFHCLNLSDKMLRSASIWIPSSSTAIVLGWGHLEVLHQTGIFSNLARSPELREKRMPLQMETGKRTQGRISETKTRLTKMWFNEKRPSSLLTWRSGAGAVPVAQSKLADVSLCMFDAWSIVIYQFFSFGVRVQDRASLGLETRFRLVLLPSLSLARYLKSSFIRQRFGQRLSLKSWSVYFLLWIIKFCEV